MPLRVATPPAAAVVSLDEMRRHLRIDTAEEDLELQVFIDAAQGMAESHAQRRFVAQTLEWVTTGFFDPLPVAPVVAASIAVQYVPDGQASLTTWSATNWTVRQRGAWTWIVPNSGTVVPLVEDDVDEPIVVTFDAGDAVADVDPKVKAAVLMMAAHLYRNREGGPAPTATDLFHRLLSDQVWCL